MRYIRGNASSYTPSNLLFVDTETKGGSNGNDKDKTKHRLFLGNAIHGTWRENDIRYRRNHCFRTIPQFWRIVAGYVRPRKPLWIFSHNAGFDATICGLWQMVDSGSVDLNFAITDSPPTIIGMQLYGCKAYWVDTLNWFAYSVDQLGKSLGIDKLPMPALNAPKEEWEKYCLRDTEIICYAMEQLFRFHRKHDLGVFKSTGPSQSLQVYRHRFMQKQPVIREWVDKEGSKKREVEMIGIIEPHDKDIVKRLERASYFQGYSWMYRVCKVLPFEQYYVERDKPRTNGEKAIALGPVYLTDVNSMYPSVMADNLFPHRLMGYAVCNDRTGLYRKMDEYACIANVLIETHTRPFPVKKSSGTNYHVGKFWTTLAGPELAIAREECLIKSVAMFAWYKQADLFSPFVGYFYPLKCEYRKNGNHVMSDLCKLMLNSLPGKFGQHGGNWVGIKGVVPKVQWQQYSQFSEETNRYESYRGLGNLLQIRSPDVDAAHTFTAIPAFVNSYARIKLYEYLRVCGFRNVFYCNVDSIHCSEEGFNRLQEKGIIEDTRLGYLRVEKVAGSAVYRDIRCYQCDGSIVVAGLSKKAVSIGIDCYSQPEFERLNTILDRPQDGTIVIREVTKEVTAEFTLGAIDSEGYTSHRTMSGLETRQLEGIVDCEDDVREV